MSPNDDLSDLSLDDIEEGLKKPGPKRAAPRKEKSTTMADTGVAEVASKKSRRFTFFMVGLILGVAGTLFLPPLVRPYLPDAFLPRGEEVMGPVLGKQREAPDRLLITLQAEQGAILATFTEQVAEIDLLVGVGDTVTLGVDEYRPFVENPRFEGIRKASSTPAEPSTLEPSELQTPEPPPMEPETGGPGTAEMDESGASSASGGEGAEGQSVPDAQTPADTTR